MPAAKDLVGQRFGRLLVTSRSGSAGGKARWECLCDCGKTTLTRTSDLRTGNTQSCGCFRREEEKRRPLEHGHARKTGVSPTYKSWQSMMTRCYNPNVKSFSDYGARGVLVCPKWHAFEGFLADMGERPAGMTIERKDSGGNYEQGNCRWATRAEQNSNTRANRFIEYKGVHMTQAEFARVTRLKQATVSYRVRAGWTPEQIANTTPHTGNRVASKLGDEVNVPEELMK